MIASTDEHFPEAEAEADSELRVGAGGFADGMIRN